MSDFFLHENILIKYWVDQCSKYELHGNKIKSAIANIPLSITPDIKENIFEDGTNSLVKLSGQLQVLQTQSN